MAENRDRGLFHHKKPEDQEVVVESTEVHASSTVVDGKPYDAKVEIKKHATREYCWFGPWCVQLQHECGTWPPVYWLLHRQ